jgi:hypothetical protein
MHERTEDELGNFTKTCQDASIFILDQTILWSPYKKKWRNAVFLLVQLRKSRYENCTRLYSCFIYSNICWVCPAEYKENNSFFPEQLRTVKTESIPHYKVYCNSSSTGPTRYNQRPLHSRSDFVQIMKWLHIHSKLYFFHLLYADQVTPTTSKWPFLETEGWPGRPRVVVPLGMVWTTMPRPPSQWGSSVMIGDLGIQGNIPSGVSPPPTYGPLWGWRQQL